MDHGSAAFESGLRPGDLLTHVNDEVIFVRMLYFDVTGTNVTGTNTTETLIETRVLLGIENCKYC